MNMKKTLSIACVVASLGMPAQVFNITNYRTADGLLSDAINCVEVDPANNYVWVGTNNGLNKYDGNSWVGFTTADGLVDNNVKAIAAVNGSVWVGTDFGVSRFDGSSWTTYTTADGLALNRIVDIAVAPDGELWFAHASFSAGVSVFDGTSWRTYGSPDLPISGVVATSFDSNGDKWFASPLDGVVHYDGTTFQAYTAASAGLLSNSSTTILCLNDDKWIGTSSGMTVLHPGNGVTNYTIMYVLPPPDTLNPVVDLAVDGLGRIWTTIYVGYLGVGGVAYWNGSFWVSYDVSDGLAGHNVRGLDTDYTNNVWVATSNGLSKIEFPIGNGPEDRLAVDLQLYPNPTSHYLHLDVEGEKHCYNSLGQQVLLTQEKVLDVSHLPAGIYHLRSAAGTRTFIKQ
jgi:ligand-binding sensor domain-containing protein